MVVGVKLVGVEGWWGQGSGMKRAGGPGVQGW